MDLPAHDVEAVRAIEMRVDVNFSSAVALYIINYPGYILPAKDVSTHNLSLDLFAKNKV